MSERRAAEGPYLDALLRTKRVIVTCGAGGVGKTTTAAALGLGAARLGRRVLVLTIDPARRLGEALGLQESGPKPARVPNAGTLDAWMLDPKIVFEGMVRRLTPDEAKVQRVLQNRIYQTLTKLVTGMQEYTAAEALYTFVESGDYDLVVLDTPPSRNALEFLEAPRKLSLFLDEKIVGVFLPGDHGGILLRRARGLVSSIFERVFGAGFFEDVQEFLGAFSGMFTSMRAHSSAVRTLLMGEQAAFLVVTSPDPSALEEGRFMHEKLRQLALPFGGFILNRSWAYTRGFASPDELALPSEPNPALATAMAKVQVMAEHERQLAVRDRALLGELASLGGQAAATPYLGGAIEAFAGLAELAESFLHRRETDPVLPPASNPSI